MWAGRVCGGSHGEALSPWAAQKGDVSHLRVAATLCCGEERVVVQAKVIAEPEDRAGERRGAGGDDHGQKILAGHFLTPGKCTGTSTRDCAFHGILRFSLQDEVSLDPHPSCFPS